MSDIKSKSCQFECPMQKTEGSLTSKFSCTIRTDPLHDCQSMLIMNIKCVHYRDLCQNGGFLAVLAIVSAKFSKSYIFVKQCLT